MVCIVGGFGGLVGVVVGGVVFGVFEVFLVGYVLFGYKNVIVFVLLFGFLLFCFGGLFGDYEWV